MAVSRESEVESHARELLQRMLGPGAVFREGQWQAIEAIAHFRKRVLVVQRTGWGKSLVYFLATRLLRDQNAGPTLLISPLLSLMRNQISMAERIGIRAATINSANEEEWAAIEALLAADTCDILLISPERLNNDRFLKTVLPVLGGRIGLFAVDEAHCISDWGHDFRPDYRRIVRVVQALPPGVPVLATTATANNRVVADVEAQLGRDLLVQRGPLARTSLRLQNIRLLDQSERLAWLSEWLPRIPGSGIVYCLTVADTERVAGWLRSRGISAQAYHADLPAEERHAREDDLLANRVKALVATVALGMGFDKPDLGFVIHYQRPGSVVAYYQQVGRAGRAVDEAYGVLLSGREDDEIQDYFIRTAFPPADLMLKTLEQLATTEGLTIRQLQTLINASHSGLERALKLLEIDGAIAREGHTYFRTPNPWIADAERTQQITDQRRAELREMQEYLEHPGCLMEFLARSLDDPAASRCGRCVSCTGEGLPVSVQPEVVNEAVTFLKGRILEVQPRRQWPTGAFQNHKGNIAEEKRSRVGRVLSLYGDAGWGREVARGKYETRYFSDELVRAAFESIQLWNPEPFPTWVTAIPSLRHPELVSSFAQRLTSLLHLPFEPVIVKVLETPEQKTMENSAYQARNVAKALRVPNPCPSGPVLLIDDIVDSGWTMAVAACLLQERGSGPVFPFALARAAIRGS